MGFEAAAAEKTKKRPCELCGGAAAVHCAADSAFLCLRCDARVHGANFLASRHQRRRLVVGVGAVLAAAAPAESATSSASSSSSSCVSTAESTAAAPAASGETTATRGRRQRGARAEAVLEGWAKRMGFAPVAARRRAAAAAGVLRDLGRCVAAARVPLRVAMAAALWSEVSSASASAKGGDAALLCRLEATAHVPARLVLTVASWMARSRRPADDVDDVEEGWAECSS